MDQIQEPNHYKANKSECIELMKEMATPEEFEGFLKLSAFKYMYRYNNKGNAQQDLGKAKQYITALKNLKDYPQCNNVFKPVTILESTADQKGPDCYKPDENVFNKLQRVMGAFNEHNSAGTSAPPFGVTPPKPFGIDSAWDEECEPEEEGLFEEPSLQDIIDEYKSSLEESISINVSSDPACESEEIKEVTIVYGDSLRDCKEFIDEHQEKLRQIDEFDFDNPIMMWSTSQLDNFLIRHDETVNLNVFPTS